MARRGLITALAGVFLAIAGGQVFADEPGPERQTELMYRLRHDCGSCHGMTLKGGLGPPLLPATIADKPDNVLVEIIREGVPGTPMPPWAFEITESEASWLVRRLRRGPDAASR
jgi:cytochrome c55X